MPGPSKRRWLQFSLRTGFIVVTGVCAALSLWVVPAERQRRAVAAIEAMGGRVEYWMPGPNEAFPIKLLRRSLPPDYVDEVFDVNLGLSQVTDSGFSHLQGLTRLRRLWLGRTNVTDAQLARLQVLQELRQLELHSTQVTDAGLVHLRDLKGLWMLDLHGTQVTDAGLAHLQGLSNLQLLDFRDTQVTEAGLAGLRKALPNCSIHWP